MIIIAPHLCIQILLRIPICGPLPEGRSWHSLTAVSDRYLILYGGFSETNVPLSKP